MIEYGYEVTKNQQKEFLNLIADFGEKNKMPPQALIMLLKFYGDRLAEDFGLTNLTSEVIEDMLGPDVN